MLLDEEPHSLIKQCFDNFNLAPDKQALKRAAGSYQTLNGFRKHHVAAEQEKLRELDRKLGSLQSQHNLTTQSHNPAEHAAEILRLDTEKFRVAKQVSDLEIEEERLAQELERLKGELEEVEAQGVQGGDLKKADLDNTETELLRLYFYRSLNIQAETDPAGNFNRAALYNKKTADSHVVTLKPEFSRFFYADYLWKHV
ncbi:Kinetochore-Ndc80 subunit Spc24 [Botryosphaeria dothidea]|uniref:Kinetochore protein Spc24 n=1 Tax=Botryosphaeria dothidea TaxID=55169 RepID=A0A8H4IQ10_9PEZI|nr:Kinetochore-Ndc80 subunit Spc24 [Botryosphaeria dothidea]KAF4305116.1 Kinetochore-Ndc80 subunit Spc24 [Botryosphaeria dothidea]